MTSADSKPASHAVLPEYAPSITYQPNGMLASVVHADGVTDTVAPDPNAMARPASISTSGATLGGLPGGDWSTGTYGRDGVGNIKAMSTDTFVYDKVSRLTTASLTVGGVAHSQAYAFDVFGNMTSVTTDGSWCRKEIIPMFSIPRLNVIESDEGFPVEVLGMTGVRYGRQGRSLLVDSEVLAGPAALVIYSRSISQWDDHETIDEDERARIVNDIRRAFRFRGLEIEVI